MPGYKEATANLKSLGIDEVVIYCVNDGAVMDAWAEDQGIDQKTGFITLMGDPSGEVRARRRARAAPSWLRPPRASPFRRRCAHR